MNDWLDGLSDKQLMFSADDAWQQTNYVMSTIENTVRFVIRDINNFIHYKSKMKGQTTAVYIFQLGYEEVIERVRAHYDALGYLTKVNQLDPSEGVGTELRVSWYKGDIKHGKESSKEHGKPCRASKGEKA